MSADRTLTILAPRGYPWAFNGPRNSRHRIRVRNYVPLNRLRSSLDGVTFYSPLDTIGADLIHGFNRIPLNTTPYVLGFESHLPRVWGHERSGYERFLYGNLLSRRCRRLIAISHYAADNFRNSLAAAPLSADARATIGAKLDIRYPNLAVPDMPDPKPSLDHGLVATFIGSHFGRKGGCVVARMAELARARGLPIHFNIISSLRAGGPIWTDPSRPDFFAPWFALLDQPNVTHHATLPNAEVRALLARSHVALLPTFADTFGFSVLEAMVSGTPVLATAQAAIPEVIEDGVDGMLLDPVRTPGHNGWIWDYTRRDDPAFEGFFTAEVERLALQGLERLVALLGDPAAYAAMCAAAHRTALHRFNSADARLYWDNLYRDCVEGRRDRGPLAALPAGAGLDAH